MRFGRRQVDRLDTGYMQQRADSELCWDTLVRFPDPYQEVCARQQCHFRVTHHVALPARHHQPEWPERTLQKKFPECLDGHEEPFELGRDTITHFLQTTTATRQPPSLNP